MMGPEPFYFPAACVRCEEALAADVCASRLTCEQCGVQVTGYDSPELQQKSGPRTVVEETTMTEPEVTRQLNNGPYLCPKCGRFEPLLEIGGMLWD